MAAEIRSRAERYRAMLARPQDASAPQSYLRRSRRSRTRHPRCCRPSQSRATTPFIAHSHTGCLADVGLMRTSELPSLGETSRTVAGWPPPEPTGIDAYAPAEIAARVEKTGIGKARLPALSLVMLAIL